MKNFRRIQKLGTMIFIVGATSVTVFASSSYTRQAEMVEAEAGQLETFKKENIEMKKENLKTQVKAGRITQEKAGGAGRGNGLGRRRGN